MAPNLNQVSTCSILHFTQNKNHNVEAAIQVGNMMVQPNEEARYLGVIMDRKLKYRSHMEHVTKKGSKFALAMSSIARSTWGTSFRYI